MSLRFLLLMRHAKHSRGRPDQTNPREKTVLDDIAGSVRELARNSAVWGGGEPASASNNHIPASALKEEGRYETLAVAKRLASFLPEWTTDKLELGRVLYFQAEATDTNPANANATEARETAIAFCEDFGFTAAPIPTPLLGPLTKSSDLEKTEGESPLEKDVKDEAAKHAIQGKNAVLFVGHQPAVGWLAGALLGRPVPIAQSEILCIDLKAEPIPALSWTISSAGDEVGELQEKIKSKMALANLLGGFITAGISVVVAMLSDSAKVQGLGVQAPVVFGAALCLVLAVALYLRTMFSYDSLLMPIRFWADSALGMAHRPPWIVERPPSGAHWILYQNMIRIWQWQFIPATSLALGGLFMLWGGVALGPIRWLSHSPDWWLTAVSRGVSLAIPTAGLFVLALVKRESICRGLPGGWSRFWSCRGLAPKFRYLCGPWVGSED